MSRNNLKYNTCCCLLKYNIYNLNCALKSIAIEQFILIGIGKWKILTRTNVGSSPREDIFFGAYTGMIIFEKF